MNEIFFNPGSKTKVSLVKATSAISVLYIKWKNNAVFWESIVYFISLFGMDRLGRKFCIRLKIS